MQRWDELFTPKVSRHVWMLAKYFDRINPDDLFQDSVTLAFRKLKQFRGESDGFEKWICQILRFQHFSNHRRKKSLDKKMDRIGKDQELNLKIRSVSIDDELSDETFRAMKTIREDERYLMYMVYVNDYSYGEMSKLLGIPLGTVMSKIHRIRGKLRRELETALPSADDPDSHTDKTST